MSCCSVVVTHIRSNSIISTVLKMMIYYLHRFSACKTVCPLPIDIRSDSEQCGHTTLHHTTNVDSKSKCYKCGGVLKVMPNRKWNEKNLLQQQFIHLSFSLAAAVRFSSHQSIKRSFCCGKKNHYRLTPERASKAYGMWKRESRWQEIEKWEDEGMKKRNTNLNGKRNAKSFGSTAWMEWRLLWIVAVELIVICDHCDAAHIWRSTIHFFGRKVVNHRQGKKQNQKKKKWPIEKYCWFVF